MSKVRSKKKPLELADLILENGLDASLEQIAEVISEWGNLFDDQKFSARASIDAESAAPNHQRPSHI